FFTDQIYFGDSEEDMVDNVIGGAGTYGVIGARLFSPGPQAKDIGWIVDAGNDFPEEVRQELIGLGTELTIREDQERQTTRGWNKYGPGDYRAFKYLTTKMRLEVVDLVEEGLFTAKVAHLICTPTRADYICFELDKALKNNHWLPMPLIVWEPVPDSCQPTHILEMYQTLKTVHIISPNHGELTGFYGIEDPIERNNPDTIEFLAGKIVEVGIGPQERPNGAIIVRAGQLGCLIACKKHAPVWLPAYYQPTEGGGNNPKVVDPTGGGNTFIGGMSISLARNGSTKFVLAAAMGIVAASFAIEQVGIPKLEMVDGQERWNGVNVKERMEEYRKRVEDMGILLDM
ncbi:Ribokinase-like protein, partial [Choiromyces venosus 120613-1]